MSPLWLMGLEEYHLAIQSKTTTRHDTILDVQDMNEYIKEGRQHIQTKTLTRQQLSK
jgi:hypothetical protein